MNPQTKNLLKKFKPEYVKTLNIIEVHGEEEITESQKNTPGNLIVRFTNGRLSNYCIVSEVDIKGEKKICRSGEMTMV